MKQSRLAYIQMRDQFVNELAVEGKEKVTVFLVIIFMSVMGLMQWCS